MPYIDSMLRSLSSRFYVLVISISVLVNTTSVPASNGIFSTSSPLSNNGHAPVCVNVTQHPDWIGPYGQFDWKDCFDAMRVLETQVEGLSKSYDFYCRILFPGQTRTDGWPLPYGVESGASAIPLLCSTLPDCIIHTGSCSVVLRMAREFPNNVLPMDTGGFLPTASAKFQYMDKWTHLISKVEAVGYDCEREQGFPGWVLRNKNIVVAFFARTSVMNHQYGIRATPLLAGSNYSTLPAFALVGTQ